MPGRARHHDQRDVASSYGILPTRSTTRSTTPLASASSRPSIHLQQYHVILEVNPKFSMARSAQRHLCQIIERQQVPLSTLVDSVVKVAPLVINHTGQFPSVTISFNLAPGTATARR